MRKIEHGVIVIHIPTHSYTFLVVFILHLSIVYIAATQMLTVRIR